MKRPRPVTKADLKLSKSHAQRSISEDKLRIREHAALAKKERGNKAAYNEEEWHVRHHTKDLKKERKYVKSLSTMKTKGGRRHG